MLLPTAFTLIHAMAYPFEGRTYPRFLDLFYRRFDVPLAELPAPPVLDSVPGRAQPPLGYLSIGEGDRRRFIPDAERAALVAAAFGKVAAGTGFQEAWRRAVKAGLAGRGGKPVSASGLMHVLRNPAYMGLLRYGQELYSAEVAPLVAESTFKSAVIGLDRQASTFQADIAERNQSHCRILLHAKELEQEPMQHAVEG